MPVSYPRGRGKLLQSYLLAQDWRREYKAARRGMLSERLRNEHSRALLRWEARLLCNQPHHHLYRAAIRGCAKRRLHPHPALGKTGEGSALQHSSVGRGSGVSGAGRPQDSPLCGGTREHVHTCTCHEIMLSEGVSPPLTLAS